MDGIECRDFFVKAGIGIIRKTGVDLSESSNARDPEIKGIRSRTTIRRDFLTKAPPPKPLRYGHICSTQNRLTLCGNCLDR